MKLRSRFWEAPERADRGVFLHAMSRDRRTRRPGGLRGCDSQRSSSVCHGLEAWREAAARWPETTGTAAPAAQPDHTGTRERQCGWGALNPHDAAAGGRGAAMAASVVTTPSSGTGGELICRSLAALRARSFTETTPSKCPSRSMTGKRWS
jgi:hypothetical protein